MGSSGEIGGKRKSEEEDAGVDFIGAGRSGMARGGSISPELVGRLGMRERERVAGFKFESRPSRDAGASEREGGGRGEGGARARRGRRGPEGAECVRGGDVGEGGGSWRLGEDPTGGRDEERRREVDTRRTATGAT